MLPKTTVWIFSVNLLFLLFPFFAFSQVTVAPRADLARIKVDETVLLVDQQPFFVRAIQYNGESFSFLKSLGFNTIQLPAPATENQLREAGKLGVWLVCLPPSSVQWQTIGSKYSPVLAWSVGEKLSARDQQVVRRTIDETRAADKAKRPIFGNVESNWNSLAQAMDIVSIGGNSIGTDLPLRKRSQFLHRVGSELSKPIWADIQTELAPALTKQAISFLGRDIPLPIEHQQLKYQLYEAITGGARGVRFLSTTKLDSPDPTSRLRASGLRWLLQHCEQMESWVSAGLVESMDMPGNELELHTIKLPGSRLVLIQRPTGFEQWTCGNVAPATIRFLSPANLGDRTYLVNELGAVPLSGSDSSTRTELQVPDCPFACCLLMTQDPVAVQTAQRFTVADPLLMQNRFELADQTLAYFHLVEQRLAATGIGFPMMGDARTRSEKESQAARRMFESGNAVEALRHLDRSDYELAAARSNLIKQQTNRDNQTVSSPLVSHVGLIPEHLNLSLNLAGATWNPNSLTGGDFENLEHMTGAGWENRSENSGPVVTRVELLKNAAVDGSYGLKMSVMANGSIPTLLQTPPLWIRSAEVAVKRGQLVRIHGLVNVESMASSPRGLTVSDSIGGDELALHFQATSGWKEFTIYRAVNRNGNLAVTFTMTGVGSAMIDEVTIRTMDRPEFSEQAKLNSNAIK